MNGLVWIRIQTDKVRRDRILFFPGAASAKGGDRGCSIGFEGGLRLMKSNRAQVEKEARSEPVETLYAVRIGD